MDIPSFILGRIKGSGGAGVSYVVVEELPATGEEGKIYLVPKEDSQTDNVYNEYMYINEEWELIGDTQADLSDYLQESDLKTINGNSIVGSGDISVGDEVIIIEGTASGTTLSVGTKANKDKIKYIFDNYDNIMNMKVYLYLTNTNPKLYVPLTTIQKNWANEFWLQGEIGNQGANYGINWGIYYSSMEFYIITGNYVNNNINISTQQIRKRYILNDNTSILGKTNTFEWTPTGNYNPATKKYVDDRITQYETLPTASASNEGKIAQYIGATDSNYTNGYFYQLVSDGEDPATYSWENIEVQASGSGGLPIITENTYIGDLEEGTYIVRDSVIIYMKKNDNNIIIRNTSNSFILQIGRKITTGIPHFNYNIISAKGMLLNNFYDGTHTIYYNSCILSGRLETSSTSNIKLPTLGIILNLNENTSGGYYGAYFNNNANTAEATRGEIACANYSYSDYSSKGDNTFISKGTLENVITGKELNLKQLSTYDDTKTQVLKNINGTLQWVTEE